MHNLHHTYSSIVPLALKYSSASHFFPVGRDEHFIAVCGLRICNISSGLSTFGPPLEGLTVTLHLIKNPLEGHPSR